MTGSLRTMFLLKIGSNKSGFKPSRLFGR